ncbi:hypothetical protein LEP1GSC185_2359 [Leptospira licerasiae serovar Varillal str. VAR 010]|uniref:Uncharacterized protein n=1 Tax=Leptospira licerasiae str. MMD4847 TaxID=1049971 RepID=A0ABN0HD66_9LEPT|nr:hypothetical protein LEP1GSC185_2359 [Leptospira licerasiae serovar Varillal str. VAR 010]EJZ43704.1 hypothetical protein LEP1GSC178_0135 [Leptospira licerasiae str. MMD4847]
MILKLGLGPGRYYSLTIPIKEGEVLPLAPAALHASSATQSSNP